jgi:hypothetical protein
MIQGQKMRAKVGMCESRMCSGKERELEKVAEGAEGAK